MKGFEELILERGKTYGSYSDTARISQAIKAAMADSPNWENLAPAKRDALEMIAVKISRILSGDPNYADNWYDVGGYAKLGADTQEAS